MQFITYITGILLTSRFITNSGVLNILLQWESSFSSTIVIFSKQIGFPLQ